MLRTYYEDRKLLNPYRAPVFATVTAQFLACPLFIQTYNERPVWCARTSSPALLLGSSLVIRHRHTPASGPWHQPVPHRAACWGETLHLLQALAQAAPPQGGLVSSLSILWAFSPCFLCSHTRTHFSNTIKFMFVVCLFLQDCTLLAGSNGLVANSPKWDTQAVFVEEMKT